MHHVRILTPRRKIGDEVVRLLLLGGAAFFGEDAALVGGPAAGPQSLGEVPGVGFRCGGRC